MSFYGYYQILCENGHYSTKNAFEDPEFSPDYCINEYNQPEYNLEGTWPIWKCPSCGAPAVWWNIVDQTNCDYQTEGADGPGWVDLGEAAEREEYKKCSLGHLHRVKEAVFKVPEKGGHLVK